MKDGPKEDVVRMKPIIFNLVLPFIIAFLLTCSENTFIGLTIDGVPCIKVIGRYHISVLFSDCDSAQLGRNVM